MQGLWGRSKYAIIPVEDYQRDRLVVSMAYGHTVQSYCCHNSTTNDYCYATSCFFQLLV